MYNISVTPFVVRLLSHCLKDIHEIFKVAQKKHQLPSETRMPDLMRCLAVQMTNQLQALCLHSMVDFDNFVHSFKREEGDHRAGFVINLKAHGKGTEDLLES